MPKKKHRHADEEKEGGGKTELWFEYTKTTSFRAQSVRVKLLHSTNEKKNPEKNYVYI